MPTLHLGVIDVPYSAESFKAPPKAKIGKAARYKLGAAKLLKASAPAPAAGSKTTGDVAEILEGKYHVFEVFFELHGQEIIDHYTEALVVSIQDALSGHNAPAPNFTEANGETRALFVKFIDGEEMNGIQPGVPTAAALAGVNHRRIHPYAKDNPPRPSFRDTGLYEAAMIAVVDA